MFTKLSQGFLFVYVVSNILNSSLRIFTATLQERMPRKRKRPGFPSLCPLGRTPLFGFPCLDHRRRGRELMPYLARWTAILAIFANWAGPLCLLFMRQDRRIATASILFRPLVGGVGNRGRRDRVHFHHFAQRDLAGLEALAAFEAGAMSDDFVGPRLWDDHPVADDGGRREDRGRDVVHHIVRFAAVWADGAARFSLVFALRAIVGRLCRFGCSPDCFV